MTDAELVTAVDTAMSTHLYRAMWRSKESDVKTSLAKYAVEDISLELPWVTQDDIQAGTLEFSAVIEQIGFLLRKLDEIMSSTGTPELQVTSESVEGLSQSFVASTNAKTARYSQRALAFIERAKSAKLGHSLRVNRG